MKSKAKQNKTKFLSGKKILTAIFVAGFVLIPTLSSAQVSSTPVDISFDPSAPNMGEQLTINYSISRDETAAFSPSIEINGNPFFPGAGAGNSGSFQIGVAETNGFIVGSNDVLVTMTYSLGTGSSLQFRGNQTLQVAAGDSSTPVTSVTLSGGVIGLSTISVNGQIGYTGPPVSSFSVNCGKDGESDRNIGTNTSFTCEYPRDQNRPYTVTVRALDADGVTLGEPATATINPVTSAQQSAEALKGPDGGPITAMVSMILGILTGLIRGVLYLIYSFIILPFIRAAAGIEVGVGSCGEGGGSGFLGVVCDGWQFVRNFVNMLFILFLIVIGLATILKIEKYNYKKLLGMLILMALLVNFSLVIGQAILKVADVFQRSIIDPRGDEILDFGKKLIYGGSFLNLGLGQDVGFLEIWKGRANFGAATVVVGQLLDLAIAFVSFVVMGAVAVFLMIRLVAIWVLLILSPFAYALMVLPGLTGMAMKWWNAFIKYAFFAPIMFFFFKLAIIVDDKLPGIRGSIDPCRDGSCSPQLAGFLFNLLQHILVLVFIFAGLLVALKLSILGANAAVSLGRRAALLPLAGAGAAVKFGVGRAGKKKMDYTAKLPTAAPGWKGRAAGAAYAVLNPIHTYKGWQARREDLRKKAEGVSFAKGRDVATSLFTWGKVMPTEEDREETSQMMEYAKGYSHLTKEQKAEQMAKLKGKRGREYKDRRNALAIVTASGGHIDDITSSKYFLDDTGNSIYYTDAEKAGGERGVDNRKIRERFLREVLGMDRQAARTRFALEEIGKQIKHEEYGGLATFEDGEYKILEGAEGIKRAITEKLKSDERRARAGAPHEFMGMRLAGMVEFDADGDVLAEDGTKWTAGKKVKFKKDDKGETKLFFRAGEMDEFNRGVYGPTFKAATDRNATEHAQARTPKYAMGGTPDEKNIDKEGYIIGDEHDLNRIKQMYKEAPLAFRAWLKNAGGQNSAELDNKNDLLAQVKGIRVFDDAGNVVTREYVGNQKSGDGRWGTGPVAGGGTPPPAGAGGGGAAGGAGGGGAGAGGAPGGTPPPAGGVGGGSEGGIAAGGRAGISKEASAEAMKKVLNEINASQRDLVKQLVEEIHQGSTDLSKAAEELGKSGAEKGTISNIVNKISEATGDAMTGSNAQQFVNNYASQFPSLDTNALRLAIRQGVVEGMKAGYSPGSKSMNDAIIDKLNKVKGT